MGIENTVENTLVALPYRSEFLWRELWISLASMIRSYTSAHGLNKKRQATVELGEDEIIVRAGERCLMLDRVGDDVSWILDNKVGGILTFTVRGTLVNET